MIALAEKYPKLQKSQVRKHYKAQQRLVVLSDVASISPGARVSQRASVSPKINVSCEIMQTEYLRAIWGI